MVEKRIKYSLSVAEKNAITERIESIIRGDENRLVRLYDDLWIYIEDRMNDVARQVQQNNVKARQAQKTDD